MMLSRMCEIVNGEASRRCEDPDTRAFYNRVGCAAVGTVVTATTGNRVLGTAASKAVAAATKDNPRGFAEAVAAPVYFGEVLLISALAVPYGLFLGVRALLK